MTSSTSAGVNTRTYRKSSARNCVKAALPVFKVLYRNTNRIQQNGGRKNEVLHAIEPADLPGGKLTEGALQAMTRKADLHGAEQLLAAMSKVSIDEAYQQLQYAIQDEVDVHRVVLSWRSWAIHDVTGMEHAATLLRQSVRYCVNTEKDRIAKKRPEPSIRALLPKLLDQHKLLAGAKKARSDDDAWISQLSETIYGSSRDQAAEAVAAALAEGFRRDAVAEAICVAANLLVLRDPGRRNAEPGKPVGSVHGASVGVHASDSANAWRNIAKVSNDRNAIASLIVGAYHTAGQSGGQNKTAYPLPEHLEPIGTKDAAMLLRDAEAAIKDKDQAKACALVSRYAELGHAPRAAFDVLLKFAVSEDGALHAEKYYRTVSEEFATTRPAFRNRQLAALARVTASEAGFPAPGYAEACKLVNG